jgi:hypothetical protein
MNCVLRDELNTLRNERERFELLFRKAEKELRNLRRQLSYFTEQSVIYYEQR